jgi:hypothetical protein
MTVNFKDVVAREVYAELGELAGQYTAEARRHHGGVRLELERAAAQIRLTRDLYRQGSISALAALDWLNAGRAMLGTIGAWSK